MKKYLIWYSAISFLVGFVFSSVPYFQSAINYLREPAQVRLLAPKNTIPEDLLESFTLDHNQLVSVEYYDSQEHLRKILDSRKSEFDVVLAPHTLIPELRLNHQIHELNVVKIPNFKNLSADFRDLPTDPGARFSVPILWGVNYPPQRQVQSATLLVNKASHGILPKFAKISNLVSFAGLDSKTMHQVSPLWVYSFAEVNSENDNSRSAEFINYFLDKSVAIELSQITNQSGTNVALECPKVEERLRPSHLRTHKLAFLTRGVVSP